MRIGWVKLHRKLLDNKFLRRDANAFKVFVCLLIAVDKNTGQWEGGRFQLAELCGLKPTTSYAASMRLVKAKMMTLSSNNKYTVFSICNWRKYQSTDDSTHDNWMTTRRQQDDTLTRIREVEKKEIKNKEKEKTPNQNKIIAELDKIKRRIGK